MSRLPAESRSRTAGARGADRPARNRQPVRRFHFLRTSGARERWVTSSRLSERTLTVLQQMSAWNIAVFVDDGKSCSGLTSAHPRVLSAFWVGGVRPPSFLG